MWGRKERKSFERTKKRGKEEKSELMNKDEQEGKMKGKIWRSNEGEEKEVRMQERRKIRKYRRKGWEKGKRG